MTLGGETAISASTWPWVTFNIPCEVLGVCSGDEVRGCRTKVGVLTPWVCVENALRVLIDIILYYDRFTAELLAPFTESSIAKTANCFPRYLNLDIVYTISSLTRLPHTALTVFGKDSIIISYLMLNIHSIKTVSSLVVYLTFDDFRYHRLRGSASPVLTATHHSYGSPRLTDFFSISALGVRPLNGHSRKVAQTTCFHARMCLLQ